MQLSWIARHALGLVLTFALGWAIVALVNATVADGVVRLALIAPGVLLAALAVSAVLRLGWLSRLAQWTPGARMPFDP